MVAVLSVKTHIITRQLMLICKHKLVGNYFIRYADHGTPFDAGLDDTVIDEDILAVDNEGSGYFSDDSEEESEELRKDFVDEDNIK